MARRSHPRPGGPTLASVRALLERRRYKEALDGARRLHQHLGSEPARAILAEAGEARVRELAARGLDVEARALARTLADVVPPARLHDLHAALDVRAGRLDPLLAPLADPDLPAPHRERLETALRRELTDLSALAACSALPADHPLRTAAATLQQAFAAVTTQAVPPQALELPEVSRRSPLAPWKLLVRAIAAFHAGDDAACERALAALAPDAAPARLAAPLHALLGRAAPPSQPGARALVDAVQGASARLHSVLADLDAHPENPYDRIARAVKLCAAAAPDRLDDLRQRVAMRCVTHGFAVQQTRQALGALPRRDARFWRMYARAAERSDEPRIVLLANRRWAAFRLHALDEGWLREQSPEAAALYLHMSGVVTALPPYLLREVRRSVPRNFFSLDDMYRGQPPEIARCHQPEPSEWYLDAAELFRRAAAAHPRAETFERWLAWAGSSPAAQDAAAAWRAAAPDDVRPLLHLLRQAEAKQALKQAEKLAEAAHQLDPLNPEIRAARFRNGFRSAVRHLQQKKAHLVERDLARLASAARGEQALVLAAVHWSRHVLSADRAAAEAALDAAGREHPAALLLFAAVGERARLPVASYLPGTLSPLDAMGAASAARVCATAEALDLPIGLPHAWIPALEAAVQDIHLDVDTRALVALGNAAFACECDGLAHAVASAGLARGDADAACLLLRSLALPPRQSERARDCAAAAAELGRRSGDTRLVSEAVAQARELSPLRLSQFGDEDDCRLSDAELQAILQRERAATPRSRGRTRARPKRRARQQADYDAAFDFVMDALSGYSLDEIENMDLMEVAQAVFGGAPRRGKKAPSREDIPF